MFFHECFSLFWFTFSFKLCIETLAIRMPNNWALTKAQLKITTEGLLHFMLHVMFYHYKYCLIYTIIRSKMHNIFFSFNLSIIEYCLYYFLNNRNNENINETKHITRK